MSKAAFTDLSIPVCSSCQVWILSSHCSLVSLCCSSTLRAYTQNINNKKLWINKLYLLLGDILKIIQRSQSVSWPLRNMRDILSAVSEPHPKKNMPSKRLRTILIFSSSFYDIVFLRILLSDKLLTDYFNVSLDWFNMMSWHYISIQK